MRFVLLIGTLWFGVLGMPEMLQAKSTPHAKSAKPAAVKGPDPAALQRKLEALVQAAGGNRTAGQPGNKLAYDWLLAQARAIKGWEIEEQSFSPEVDFALQGYNASFEPFSHLPKNAVDYMRGVRALKSLTAFAESLRGKPMSNLILRKKGSSPKNAKQRIILMAHFDTITNRREPFELFPKASAPGADNNGAAVVSLLALAEALSDFKPVATLELVFLNAGEAYYLGARAYARELEKQGLDVRAVDLNMIGWDGVRKDLVHLYIRSQGHPGFERDTPLAYMMAGGMIRSGLTANIVRHNADRSDHWAFWKSFHAATLVSQDWEHGFNDQHYHSPGDTPQTVDWPFVSKIEKGLELGVRKMLGTGKDGVN